MTVMKVQNNTAFMKIYILLAHPNKDTFNGEIADAIERQKCGTDRYIRCTLVVDLASIQEQ